MAWEIIFKSFGVIVVIMLVAQALFWLLGGKAESAEGEDR